MTYILVLEDDIHILVLDDIHTHPRFLRRDEMKSSNDSLVWFPEGQPAGTQRVNNYMQYFHIL